MFAMSSSSSMKNDAQKNAYFPLYICNLPLSFDDVSFCYELIVIFNT